MPSWNEVLSEMLSCDSKRPIDQIRKKYVRKLSEYRQNPLIIYYSGFLHKINDEFAYATSINDLDTDYFMQAIHSLKIGENKHLDLILHTPGGNMSAIESIVNYLHRKFDSITCFVPQLAMSAGTTLACSCDEIYMGKHSSIGPIDPQLGRLALYGIIDEYEYIKRKVLGDKKNNIPPDHASMIFWQEFIKKYSPAFINECYQVVELSKECLKNFLTKRMLKNDPSTVQTIVDFLSSHKETKLHGRHINMETAKNIGLKIRPLEEDSMLQDLVLTVHHCYMHMFENTDALKVVETPEAVVVVNR